MILKANAVIYPRTMMIHFKHAFVAYWTVMCAVGFLNVAFLAFGSENPQFQSICVSWIYKPSH